MSSLSSLNVGETFGMLYMETECCCVFSASFENRAIVRTLGLSYGY